MVQTINAHDATIACMTLTLDVLLLATASTKGYYIISFVIKSTFVISDVEQMYTVQNYEL